MSIYQLFCARYNESQVWRPLVDDFRNRVTRAEHDLAIVLGNRSSTAGMITIGSNNEKMRFYIPIES
jgi:hypothetical protein